MKAIKLLLTIAGVIGFVVLIGLAGDASKKRCEVDTAQKLGAPAKWVNGKCMVKGWGKFE